MPQERPSAAGICLARSVVAAGIRMFCDKEVAPKFIAYILCPTVNLLSLKSDNIPEKVSSLVAV